MSSKIKILFIEDDLLFRDLVAKKFGTDNFDFKYAGTGEEGLEILKKYTPDMILLDIMLPGTINGFQVLEKIKSEEQSSNVHVIILSNMNGQQEIDKGLKLGASQYLVKASVLPGDVQSSVIEILNESGRCSETL